MSKESLDHKEFDIDLRGKSYKLIARVTSEYNGGSFAIDVLDADGNKMITLDDFGEGGFLYLANALILAIISGKEVYQKYRYWEISNELAKVIEKGGKDIFKMAAGLYVDIAAQYDKLESIVDGAIKGHKNSLTRRDNFSQAYDKRIANKVYPKRGEWLKAYSKARDSIYDEAPAIEAGSTVVYHGKSGDSIAEVISINEEAGTAKIKTERGANINVPLDSIVKSNVDYSALKN